VELIEKLRSENSAERETASRRLKGLGPAAIPDLEKVEKDADAEVAARARAILRFIQIDASLTRGLKEALPGAAERLAAGEKGAWTREFMEVLAVDGERLKHPTLRRDDFACLVVKALEERPDRESIFDILEAVSEKKIRAATKALHALMDYPDEFVRGAVVNTLESLGDPDLIPLLRALFRDASALNRETALTRLAFAGDRALLPEMLRGLQEKAIQEACARALGLLKVREGLPSALELLKNPVSQERDRGVKMIAAMGFRDQAPLLVPLLADVDPSVKMSALEALERLHAADQIAAILPLLKDGDLRVRRGAMVAVEVLRAVDALPTLIVLLDDADALTRGQAAHAVGRLGGKSAVLRLIRMLDDPVEDVRSHAFHALGWMKSAEAIPRLMELLAEPDGAHLGDVVWTLSKLGHREAIPRILPLLQHERKAIREEAAMALGLFGERSAIPKLQPLLRDPEENVRIEALDALETMKATDSVPAVAELLSDRIHRVRRNAARTLVALGSRAGVPLLLEEEDFWTFNEAFTPESIRRLEGIPVTGPWEGTRSEVLAGLARDARLKLVLSEGCQKHPWMAQPVRLLGGSVAFGLSSALEPRGCAVIESGDLRILTAEEGAAFWTGRLADNPK